MEPTDPDPTTDQPGTVLVLGATGYIGGRLVPELLADGHRVRCLARDPRKLDGRPWRSQVEVVTGDLLEPDSLPPAFEGVRAVYYLVHSVGTGQGFEERERRCARNAADGAASAGVAQIIYLGGLGRDGDDLSAHLRSRHEVGRELAAGPTPVTELRAAVILGSGSASFEMLRGLVEVLPIMVTPRWVWQTRCQPTAVADVLTALRRVLGRPDLAGIHELGGADVVTYGEMMQAYAEVAGLRPRLIVPVPVLTPALSAHWVRAVTSLPGPLATDLVLGLQNDVVVGERPISRHLDLPVLGLRDALRRALTAVQDLEIPTSWAAATTARSPALPRPWDPDWAGGTVLEDRRDITVAAPPELVMAGVRSLGGDDRWLGYDVLWSLRGAGDALVGGVGGRRGRRHPSELAVGDVVDVFRVEELTDSTLVLRAEMRMPGHGWLEWQVEPVAGDDGSVATRLTQRARFVPSGLWGRLYWLALVPFHALVFARMLGELRRRAEAATATPPTDRYPRRHDPTPSRIEGMVPRG